MLRCVLTYEQNEFYKATHYNIFCNSSKLEKTIIAHQQKYGLINYELL